MALEPSKPWQCPRKCTVSLSMHRHNWQSSCKRSKTAQSRACGFCRASQMPHTQPPSPRFLRPDVKLATFSGSFHPTRHQIHHMKALSWTVTEKERKAEKALCSVWIKYTKEQLFAASPSLPLSLCTLERLALSAHCALPALAALRLACTYLSR